MKLLKVSVPNFRNLQNVELTFEPDLTPAVFPIASQNGGGKSTFLQLIFTLFHCSINKERHQFVNNLCIAIGRNNLELLFENSIDFADFKFYDCYHKKHININFKIYRTGNDLSTITSSAKEISIQSSINEIYRSIEFILHHYVDDMDIYREERTRHIDNIHNYLTELSETIHNKSFKEDISRLNLLYIIPLNLSGEYCSHFLALNSDFHNYEESLLFSTYIGKRMFLAAPSTQPYLFLDRMQKRYLMSSLTDYYNCLIEATKILPNLYLYNQLTVKELIDAFSKARDEDWKQALKSNNLAYGSNIRKLTEDFHDFLGHDKYILPTPDLDSVVIQKQISETEKIQLEPEDLSHGELRRLGLYAWIKYNIPENSIVLIDEVENALHPDWQYNIADELASWGNNQYLLATHSFHLCEALTPKHVKEIEPKMRKPVFKAVD